MANEKWLIAENDVYALFDENGTAKLHVVDIDLLPRVDAVEVVRCKDCVHMKVKFNARFCEVWGMFNGMGDEGFCNYGERKDGDQS